MAFALKQKPSAGPVKRAADGEEKPRSTVAEATEAIANGAFVPCGACSDVPPAAPFLCLRTKKWGKETWLKGKPFRMGFPLRIPFHSRPRGLRSPWIPMGSGPRVQRIGLTANRAEKNRLRSQDRGRRGGATE